MEIVILILIIVLCLCLVYVTEIMKKMCDRMNWLQDQFSSFKDYNDKEYAEIMKQVNDLRLRLKSLEYKVIEDENDNCDNFYTVHSQIYTMGCRVKKNEEDTYKIIKNKEECFDKQLSTIRAMYKDSERYFENQVNSLRAINKKLTFAVEENKEMLNEICTKTASKERKEENE